MASKLKVEFPAFDRLMDFLEGRFQHQLQQQIDDLTVRLKAGNTALADVVEKQTQTQGQGE